jgi:hypothetical protein|tara:strand:- start:151 stop:453 length:303 start_codon:yes stop_codon:yes gene_type:complete
MRHLYQTPVVTVKGVADLLDIQSNTAAALIRDFEKYCVLSRAEIQSLLELKDTEHLRKQYTLPSLKAGYIEIILPDKPSSKLQKHRLAAKGIRLQELINR